jgi:hypothetical protein
LEITLQRWKGPISAAFGVSKVEECTNVAKLVKKYSKIRNFKAKCIVNEFVFRERTEVEQDFSGCNYIGTTYPVNILRNAALLIAETDLVFLIDVDFVPDV